MQISLIVIFSTQDKNVIDDRWNNVGVRLTKAAYNTCIQLTIENSCGQKLNFLGITPINKYCDFKP